jgi:SPP1 gp7 family putative phage head morphogenesis protein
MDIAFNCEKCGQHIVIDGGGMGMTVPCPTCGVDLIVPTYLGCARGAITNIGVDEIVTPQGIIRKLVMNKKNWIPDCPQNIYEQLQHSLLEGINNGETMRELAKRVQNEFKAADKDRAFVIAQTETQAAYGEAQFHSLKQAGFTTKRWETSKDELVRKSHRKCKAQGAIPIDQPFSNGLMYPGDLSTDSSEAIGCRCFLAPGK